MLINLSNHPSNKWSAEQLSAARAIYYQIKDIPFPNIDPGATIDEIIKLAKEYALMCDCNLILYKMPDGKVPPPDAVHIMGEMTFTYNVVKQLEKLGITAVASTTERIAVEDENGQKTSVFKFIQFRPYQDYDEIPY